jgi:hypothetical protein
MNDCINNSNMTAFWKLWNSNKRTELPNCVLSADKLAECFIENFIVSSDNSNAVDKFVNEYACYSKRDTISLFTVEDIEKACHDLRVSNCRDYKNLSVKHVLFCAHPVLFVWLKRLFNCMIVIVHGFVPDGFGSNVIVPVVKNRNASAANASNYRPVSIGPIFTKVFEQCLVPIFDPLLHFNDNQFGFVKNGGCSKALFTFRSTVQYFRGNGSRVYVASLDLSKAFDRVNHYGLLHTLLLKGVPLYVINVLLSWFSKLSGSVSWNNSLSVAFNIASGVPQGSINGPKFFNCVMDELLHALSDSNVGCYINGCFAGAIAYADDLLLLSSSLSKLQLMLDICCRVGNCYDLSFNPTKCLCGAFGVRDKNRLADLNMYNTALKWSDKMIYLGITFVFGVELSIDITSRLHKFHAAVCAVLKDRLPNFEHIYVRLLLSKCLPILYYGLDSLSIDCKVLQAVTKCWNMAFRWIFGLRKYDSTRLLLKSCNTMSAKFLLHRCWFLFFNSVSLSQVPVVHNLWCWCRSLISYNRLLSLYNLVDVSCRADIYTAVAASFDSYCSVSDDINDDA